MPIGRSHSAPTTVDDDVARLRTFVESHLPPNTWPKWPGGWRGEIEAALLDAVLSIRARYGTPDSGVRAAIGRWRLRRVGDKIDDLEFLASAKPHDLVEVLRNHQRLPCRTTKAEAVIEAATRLGKAGVRCAVDLDIRSPAHRAAYTGVPGLGPVTWGYFGMLLGLSGVKADTWLVRVVAAAVGSSRDPAQAAIITKAAAVDLGVDPIHLDHATWSWGRRNL